MSSRRRAAARARRVRPRQRHKQAGAKYIWDRFSRASQKYKRGDSTGLGLSIVRSILKSHDAVFGVNSAVGKGSDFYFELPLVEPPQN